MWLTKKNNPRLITTVKVGYNLGRVPVFSYIPLLSTIVEMLCKHTHTLLLLYKHLLHLHFTHGSHTNTTKLTLN